MIRLRDYLRRIVAAYAHDKGLRARTAGLLAACVFVLFSFLILYAQLFGPVDARDTTSFEFLITPEQANGDIGAVLADAGIVRSALAFDIARLASGSGAIRGGGYRVSLREDAWSVADTLSKAPYLAWVTVPAGLRKEQMGDFLSDELTWTPEERREWDSVSFASTTGVIDGAYFPDVYLIPSDQTPTQIATRLLTRYEDATATYADAVKARGLSWQDVFTLASLVEREAAKNDKPLIAGILENRLKKHMNLQVDATLQYAKGTPEDWWPSVVSADKYLDSPFNTYENAGLPPAPIANPSLASVVAVIHPATTSCLYYLHDTKGTIHCSPTYAGQVANVKRYLR